MLGSARENPPAGFFRDYTRLAGIEIAAQRRPARPLINLGNPFDLRASARRRYAGLPPPPNLMRSGGRRRGFEDPDVVVPPRFAPAMPPGSLASLRSSGSSIPATESRIIRGSQLGRLSQSIPGTIMLDESSRISQEQDIFQSALAEEANLPTESVLPRSMRPYNP